MFADLIADAALGLYRMTGWAATPAIGRLLRRRVARGREDPNRLSERWGRTEAARPPGALVWLHAASIGESLSALPLLERLRAERPDLGLLVTTGSVTSAKLMAERLPDGAVHQYLPVDLPGPAGRFLEHWRPALGIFVESEIWPTLLTAAHRQGVTLALVNGRMSPESLAAWRWGRPLIRRLLGYFSLVLAQSPADAERLRDLGAPAPLCPGNLKFAAAPPPVDEAALAELRRTLGDRPCWLAASTHPGEESAAAQAHGRLAPRFPGLLTVIAPRHPDRGTDIATALEARGLRVARRAAGEGLEPRHDVYLTDTVGELGLFYRLCGLALVGGTLVAKGGQNPLEPAKLRCAVLAGPHFENFAAIAEEMSARGAMLRVEGPEALVEQLADLLADSDRPAAMIEAAEAYARGREGVIDEVFRALRDHLPPRSD